MSENTKIEWCDHTWSPWRGCTKVSPGCANCYAEKLSHRNPAVLGNWGKGKPRVLAKNWNKPVKWNKASTSHWKLVQFRHPRVFPSLCDWLDEDVDIHWLARFLALIHSTPNLDWLLLTKRPEAWRKRIASAYSHMQSTAGDGTPQSMMVLNWLDGKAPKNVWVGTSVEDQTRADERIPDLLKIPAKLRFLSVEPLLGSVNLLPYIGARTFMCECGFHATERTLDITGATNQIAICYECGQRAEILPAANWVIVGGESGPGARPCKVEWIRCIVAQCKAARVPCFVKQLGSNPVRSENDEPFERVKHRSKYETGYYETVPYHRKGGDPAEWPEDIRVRQFPEVKP